MSGDYFGVDNTAGIDQSQFGDRGSLIFDPSYGANYYVPTYDGNVTTIRMLPFFDTSLPDRPEIPYRGGPGFTRFSPWFMSYPIFRGLGVTNKISLVVNDPYVNPSFDQNANPLCILSSEIRRAAAHAKKNNGRLPDGRTLHDGSTMFPHGWYGLIEGSDRKGAAIPVLNSVVYVQCLIYQHKNKKGSIYDLPIGLRPDDGPAVMELTGGLWTRKIAKQLNELAGTGAQPNDFENYYKNGDPVSMQYGRFLHIFKIGSDPRVASAAVAQASNPYGQSPAGQSAGSNDSNEIGYDCFFTKGLPGYGPASSNNDMTASLNFPPDHAAAWVTARIREQYVPFSKLIKVYSPVQQAAFVASVIPPDVLAYAWRGHPEWLTPDVMSRIGVQVQPPINVTTQPAAPYQMPTGGIPAWNPTAPATPAAPAAPAWAPPTGPVAPIPGLTLPPPPAAAPANPSWTNVAANATAAVPTSFQQSTVAPPPPAAPGSFFTAPVPTSAPFAAPPVKTASDPVSASLPTGASEFATPAPALPAPPSAPTPPGSAPIAPGVTNFDHLKQAANQPV